MDAQCISNTTRVCLKALEKHFFLLETHFKDLVVVRGRRWWLQRQGYDMLAPTKAGTARGSSALVWKTELWSLELSETISPRLLLGLPRHANGSSLRVRLGMRTGGA